MAGYNYYAQPGQGGSTSRGSANYNYYNPGSTYGGGRGLGEWASTPVGDNYLENNKEASFTRYLADRGIRDYTGLGEFARGQFGKIKTGYEAALGTNENLTWQNYLQGMGNNLENEYRRLTPEQRGENASLYSTRARYIPR